MYMQYLRFMHYFFQLSELFSLLARLQFLTISLFFLFVLHFSSHWFLLLSPFSFVLMNYESVSDPGEFQVVDASLGKVDFVLDDDPALGTCGNFTTSGTQRIESFSS